MLEGKRIWLTRPEGQAENLSTQLQEAGAKIESMPMLAIQPLAIDEVIKKKVLDLDRYYAVFFISTNAARLGMEVIHNYWPQFPVQLKLYAVGPTTAGVLKEFGLTVEYPEGRMSSEALLELDSLKQVANKKALIVRGVGGRELLATDLRERGAQVDYLEIYRRECPAYKTGELRQLLDKHLPDAIVVTSAEALENLKGLLERDGCSLSDTPLFVSSERIAEIASKSGFSNTVTMSGADDEAIIQSLETNC